MNEQEQAYVILINNRYFSSNTKKRIITAWSLAGAKLFLKSSSNLIKVLHLLYEKGYNPVLKTVSLNH